MIEELKDIKDYEGLYAITRDGRVWSYKSKKFLKHGLVKGYHRVCLCKEGKCKNFRVHRLVAQTFIPNPEGLPEVNHKDEDKSNNNVNNLEWCSYEYNINYGTRNERAAKKLSKRPYLAPSKGWNGRSPLYPYSPGLSRCPFKPIFTGLLALRAATQEPGI